MRTIEDVLAQWDIVSADELHHVLDSCFGLRATVKHVRQYKAARDAAMKADLERPAWP
jgi:hypothetical protein